MSFADWNYVKQIKLVKKVKAKFRMEFETENCDEMMSNLLVKQCFRTKEAKGFANLVFDECGVIDLDLRISDIRNYMTDLLTQNTAAVPSQYDTTIIAELGQILNVYQAWIDGKNSAKKTEKELEKTDGKLMENAAQEEDEVLNEEDQHIKDMMELQDPLFGVPFQLHHEETESFGAHNSNDHESDFYSRLLDEVQQKAVFEHDDAHANPKDLVMDYIGFDSYKEQTNDDEKQKDVDKEAKEVEKQEKKEKEYDDDDALYDYEYSDDTEEEEQIEKANEKEDEDAALYQYDDDDDEEDMKQDQKNGNGAIFSRCHSPPPRHRKEEEEEDMECKLEIEGEMNEEEMDANDRHYYNARYPPRRGRYGGRSNEKYHYQRYNVNNNKSIINNPVKMEWKKKENKQSTENTNENEDIIV
eukprot:182817_1